ncbi:retrovirus-related Pol polyprotein from transposon 17.6 [Trichonephila clavipes]|nr:retrovirus-related Pol polyprotein from transposon 17.6 [Trichonephila clavipes]
MSVCTGKIKFLGYEITQGHYSPSNPNIETIRKLAPPKDVKELQRFLGSINVYQKFIKDYAKLRVPLNKLLKKMQFGIGHMNVKKLIKKLKNCLISKPILKLYNSQYPCHVFCDASQESIGVVLKQQHPDGTLYPIAYHSRQLLKHEKNYTISEKECLAIIDALDKFHCYLHGSKFTIHTDHAALQWLKSVKHLTGRLFRWSLKLSQYEYSIVYIKEQVTYEYNNSPHDVTGFPPAYLMFGTLPYDSPLPNQVKLNYPPIQQARQIAVNRTIKHHKINKQRYDRHYVDAKFKVGDLVLYQNFSYPNSSKLQSPYNGPFKVVRKLSNVTYEIDKPNQYTGKLTDIVHSTRLKPFHSKSNFQLC